MVRYKRRVKIVMFALAYSLSLVAAGVVGCSWLEGEEQEKKVKPTGTVIARVGDTYMTLEDLQASIPPEYSGAITRDQNIRYVQQWINTELLYQEALRQKIDSEPEIKARLEKMKKDLLSSEVINRYSLQNPVDIGEQAVREYYEANRSQFVREHNVVRYESIVVDDRELAQRLRYTATHENFHELARTHSKAGPLGTDGSAPFVAVDAIPQERIRNGIQIAGVPSITGPYCTEDGCHILRVINKAEKGTTATMEEVRDEIVARLSNNAQKGMTDRVLTDVKARADMEFHIDVIPGADVAGAADAVEEDKE